MSDEPNVTQTPEAPAANQVAPGPSAAPAEPADPRGDTHEPNVIVRLDGDRSKKEFERKYAFWTWCPSQGHLYDGRFPGGEVVLSPMTTSEEKILQQSGKDRMEIIDTLVQRCLVKCPVPYEELLIPDMFYLLLVIRNITYGSFYKFRLECPRCSLEYQHSLTIPDGLKLRCLTDEDEGEPWEVVLPMSEDRISFRLLRLKDETDIRRWTRQAYQRSVQVGDPGYTYRLAKHVVAINGNEMDAVKRLDYVESMIGGDSNALRQAIDKHDFGVRLTLDSECPGCAHASQMRLPFDRKFFRPSSGEGES